MATKDTYIYGLGRRKAATARVRLYKGKGNITINENPHLNTYLTIKVYWLKLPIH